jgi:hypothetical protein
MRRTLLLLAVLALLAGCTGEEEPGAGAAQEPAPVDGTPPPAEAGDAGAADSGARDSGAADSGARDSGPPDATAADPRAASGAGTDEARELPPPSAVQPVDRAVAADLVIGELEDRLDGPEAVLGAVDGLFAALAEGRIPSGLLAEGVREQLENRLSYMLERAAVSPQVRIGLLARVREDTYRVPVVAFGRDGGRTGGEIYVANSGGSWYISDILVDLTRIDEDALQPVFEPGSGGPALF